MTASLSRFAPPQDGGVLIDRHNGFSNEKGQAGDWDVERLKSKEFMQQE